MAVTDFEDSCRFGAFKIEAIGRAIQLGVCNSKAPKIKSCLPTKSWRTAWGIVRLSDPRFLSDQWMLKTAISSRLCYLLNMGVGDPLLI
jgi:hypothetical protein